MKELHLLHKRTDWSACLGRLRCFLKSEKYLSARFSLQERSWIEHSEGNTHLAPKIDFWCSSENIMCPVAGTPGYLPMLLYIIAHIYKQQMEMLSDIEKLTY